MLPSGYDSFDAYFCDALKFFAEYQWLFNCAVTDILVYNTLDEIPHEWCEVLLTLTNDEFNQFPQGLVKESWPGSLKMFCEMCQKMKLTEKLYGMKEENMELPSKLRQGLSAKKLHEICQMAQIIHEECVSSGSRTIVDFGSGLGYVGQLLHTKYLYSVLGLESNSKLVAAAEKRQKDLCCTTEDVVHIVCNINADTEEYTKELIMKNVFKNSKSSCHCQVPKEKCCEATSQVGRCNSVVCPADKSKLQAVKECTENIKLFRDKDIIYNNVQPFALNCAFQVNIEGGSSETANSGTEYTEKIRRQEKFPASTENKVSSFSNLCSENVCLIGLHPCADLSAIAARMFVSMPILKHLILLPCCYHRMTKQKTSGIKCDKLSKDYSENFINFPMSYALKNAAKNFPNSNMFFQKYFLRLAAQETSARWKSMSQNSHKQHSLQLMARALLYLCAHKGGFMLRKKRRRGVRNSNATSFDTILNDMLHRYEFIHLDPSIQGTTSTGGITRKEVRQKMLVLWKEYKHMCHLAELYTALQLAIQRAVESIVLLDKVAYLKESSVSCDIVKLLDENLSPRCYCIVARK